MSSHPSAPGPRAGGPDVVNHPHRDYDVIVERCINHSRALYSLKILNDQGVRTVNTALEAMERLG